VGVGGLALWNYHPAPPSAQIRNKANTSALCVYWCIAHRVNDPTSGTTQLHLARLGEAFGGDGPQTPSLWISNQIPQLLCPEPENRASASSPPTLGSNAGQSHLFPFNTTLPFVTLENRRCFSQDKALLVEQDEPGGSHTAEERVPSTGDCESAEESKLKKKKGIYSI